MSTPIGVRLGPRSEITELSRQAVLDAAAALQLARSEIAHRLSERSTAGVEAEVVARGIDAIQQWLRERLFDYRELLSVRPGATIEQLRVSVPVNRDLVDAGQRMISAFHLEGLDDRAQAFIGGERKGRYLLAVAPVQMKIMDRRQVLLAGPFVGTEPTVMLVRAPGCLQLAWRYWHAVVASSIPATTRAPHHDGLSPRQLQVGALLAADARDEAIAAALGVSVRTVRSDVARLLEILGVQSRFAAGLRFGGLGHEAERSTEPNIRTGPEAR